jgi:tetratricopeptide (TPR) repeat protein
MLKMILLLSLVTFSFAQADMKSEAMKSWQNRDDEKSLLDALSKFEKAPQDLDTLTHMARGHFIYAEYFLNDEGKKMDAYEKAKNYGDKALMLNPDFKKHSDDDIEKAISVLTEKEVAPLYWRAASLGKWARLNGIFKSLKYKDEILASIKKVEQLKPDFFYASVPRYWGSYYALAPSIAGGDMDKSKDNFMKAIKNAPEYLGTKNLYAELYLVKKDNKKDFKAVLQEVISAPNGPAEITPENKLEKKKAQKLLDKAEDLF